MKYLIAGSALAGAIAVAANNIIDYAGLEGFANDTGGNIHMFLLVAGSTFLTILALKHFKIGD